MEKSRLTVAGAITYSLTALKLDYRTLDLYLTSTAFPQRTKKTSTARLSSPFDAGNLIHNCGHIQAPVRL
jgi:hypothetical protein